MWRHGDVLIMTVAQIPAGSSPRHAPVLAYGEITGHSHRVHPAESAQLWEQAGIIYLQVLAERATIIHEEHHPITLPRGIYKVWMQREYTPEAIRQVRD